MPDLSSGAPPFDPDAFAARLVDRRHREAFALWRDNAPPGGLPHRTAVADPFRLSPETLPWIALYDVVRSGGARRFRFRLVGTGNVMRFQRDMTGRWFEDAYAGEIFDQQMAIFGVVADSGLPSFADCQLPIPDRRYVNYQRMILPLAGDDPGRCDHLMALLVFEGA